MSGATGPDRLTEVSAAGAGVEARIARLLTLGTRVAVGLLAVGSILLIAGGGSPLDADWPPLDLAALPADLAALHPAAYLWLGLVAMIATPLLRVTVATGGFARAGERRLAALGAGVLVIIGLAVLAGSLAA